MEKSVSSLLSIRGLSGLKAYAKTNPLAMLPPVVEPHLERVISLVIKLSVRMSRYIMGLVYHTISPAGKHLA